MLSTGQAGMPTLPECLSLPAAMAVCAFTRNAPEGGGGGENRYFLRNEANKSFRINRYGFGSMFKKATQKRKSVQKAPNTGVIQWLLERFADRCESGMAKQPEMLSCRTKQSTGLTGLYSKGAGRMPTLPECLSLPDAVAIYAFTRNAP